MKFTFDGRVFTISEFLEANAHDAEFCAWVNAAQVGDTFPTVVGPVERIA